MTIATTGSQELEPDDEEAGWGWGFPPDKPNSLYKPIGKLIKLLHSRDATVWITKTGYINLLVDAANRVWYSSENESFALVALRGMIAAAVTKKVWQPEYFTFPLGAFLDRYHHDRALNASSLLGSPPPSNTPPRDTKPQIYWEPGTPSTILPPVVKLLEQEMPDKFLQYAFHQESTTFIFAQYGDWYVRVANWQ